MGDKYVRWLSSLSKKDLNLAGGKGANLGEMYNNKFPVPQAFVVTTDAFFYFLKETKIKDEIRALLNRIDVDDSDKLAKIAEEIRETITNAKMPEVLEREIIEAYDHFNVDLDGLKSSPGALSILRSSREPVFVSVRSSATAEDLEGASFAGQQESFINVRGNKELIEKVKRCLASIFTARSLFYRKKKGFEDFVGIAAVVQRMVNSEKSGVMFSRHPVKNNDEILIEAVFGQGEGIVSGQIKPDQHTVSRDFKILDEKISDKKIEIIRTSGGQTKTKELGPEKSKGRVLKTYEIKQLAEFAIKLENHYKKPQDIEFAIENGEIYILQTRPMTALKKDYKEMEELEGHLLTSGLAASPGVASGPVRIVNSMEDLGKVRDGDILVTTMTNPDMVVTMQKAAAIVTSEGGVTAHAAIVSREMGIPAVVGTSDAMDVLTDGMEVTVDGFNGRVFAGKAENKSVKILPIVHTKTKIKVLVDLPQFAERAAKTEADGVGLVRLEGLIASSGKHPLAYEGENKLEEYQEMLKKGLLKIAEVFIGKPIWVRTSDIRSDEYSNLEGAPKEIEKNPMLGDHGIHFSLKHPEILKAELKAINELTKKGHKFGVMFPQIISVEEVRAARKIFNEVGMDKVAFGLMIETPAATILIKDLCEEGIDFISFGTNDLTQYTLAIDRGNEHVQDIYNEMNWAVLKQIARVIRECKKQKVETSICGQAGSNKEMVEFLVKQGIDSISVNADVAREISELVRDLEGGTKVEEKVVEKSEEKKVEEKNILDEEIVGEREIEEKNDLGTEEELVEAEEVEHHQGHSDIHVAKEDIFD
ncbi:MAG: phosphoenolpyruvate synthase [archaeon]|nr:phosphoenolpyruvate synthase [archaeon]MCR4323616.1 phosphoenolpyruvate synthase [Nanoarchaeota archaeon]